MPNRKKEEPFRLFFRFFHSQIVEPGEKGIDKPSAECIS